MEFKSILENLSKLGVIVSPLESFIDKVEEEISAKVEKKEDEK